ncbi:hypothetical protein AB4455_01205 [Vibrio sp. 10N.261.46.E12]|uniref:Uncharacterized protein n=1 Tax=Vibrio splendidus TaxID=29497 RepID=A0A2N7JPU2_VIBSP|nr:MULTISPECIES: hypothetical protein [Vibrio]PML89257.1 hypothetical protein BCT66_07875 [Vibrio sp. 10N.261.49.E11]PMM37441.1 hypothetical protein BCT58_25425 [Vibrio lentus]PMM49565.1 hypothetical protein BCT54_24675 [Vibrio splendidus]PMN80307.1 hypothetical protein BCT25_01965 [Vibrio sp. 10N.261.45.A6]PMN82174.1 hypothetical protein BCT22_13790 [Vibrio sp. 10N.261.45.A1]
MKKVKLGFYAIDGGNAFCYGESLVVANDKNTIRKLAAVRYGYSYQNVYLHDTLEGLALGGEYALDEPAFNLISQHVTLDDFEVTEMDILSVPFRNIRLKVSLSA